MRPLLPSTFVIALLAAISAALAQTPEYYRVKGVAANDVLNIRMEPKPTAEIAGELVPDAWPVEVLETITVGSSTWGRVIAADNDGWVNMAFLEPAPVALIGETAVPEGLACSGTEPFWDATFSKSAVAFSAVDEEGVDLPITTAIAAIARPHRFSIVAGEGKSRMTAALAFGETCSDGMSDRNYGWRVDLLIELPKAEYPRAYEGCCRLPLAGN